MVLTDKGSSFCDWFQQTKDITEIFSLSRIGKKVTIGPVVWNRSGVQICGIWNGHHFFPFCR
jgi:hypothetical protein